MRGGLHPREKISCELRQRHPPTQLGPANPESDRREEHAHCPRPASQQLNQFWHPGLDKAPAPAPKTAQKGRLRILAPAAERRSPDTARGRLAPAPPGASRRASWCSGRACRARAQGPAASALLRRPGHRQPGRFPPGAGRSMRAPRSPWSRPRAQTSEAAEGTGERRSPEGPKRRQHTRSPPHPAPPPSGLPTDPPDEKPSTDRGHTKSRP